MLEPRESPDSVGLTTPWLAEEDADALWRFMDVAPVALLAAGDDREILRVNERWSRLTGLARDEVEQKRIDDLVSTESRAALEMRWRDILQTGLATARLILVGPDGSRTPVRTGGFANVLPGVHVGAWLQEREDDASLLRGGRRRTGQLTKREQESLRLVAMGMTTVAAAERLGISPETVRTHVRNAMNKLGARTRAQAIAVAMRDGEISS